MGLKVVFVRARSWVCGYSLVGGWVGGATVLVEGGG